ncbi:MAG TPA: hypothetical protein VJX66_04820 [Amycolatopsis sp.]|nr:hypothetical protein [Amycolatopsis sp.]
MHEHPPGYETEQPVDLGRRLAAAPPPDRPKETPKVAPGPLAVEVPGSWLTVIANVKPRTFKTTTARMLEAVLGPVRDDLRFVEGARRPVHGLVVADSASDPTGAAWRPGIQAADQLVIPVPDDPDAARAAKWMLDELEDEGRFTLTTGAITAMIRTGRDRRFARRARRYFAGRTAEVVEIRPRQEDPAPWVPLAEVLLRRLAQQAATEPAGGESGSVVPLHPYQQKVVS